MASPSFSRKTGRRHLFRSLIAGLISIGFTQSAIASCYSPKEAAAERAIRIHSELMVVGLTCAAQFDDPALFVRYADFTNKHSGDIRAHESTMIGYFAKTAEGDPKRRFDHWRTSIANSVSTRAALSSAQIYCGSKQEMVNALGVVSGFGHQKVSAMLDYAPEASVISRPMCAQDAVALSTVD
jgi:hypothetical protein